MKPRTRWLTRFANWFFNTSPEWIEPTQKGPERAVGPQERGSRQKQQRPSESNGADPTSEDADKRRR